MAHTCMYFTHGPLWQFGARNFCQSSRGIQEVVRKFSGSIIGRSNEVLWLGYVEFHTSGTVQSSLQAFPSNVPFRVFAAGIV